MIALVMGGGASGKSEWAENLSVRINRGRMAYIATMHPYDDECREKIEKHRAMRAGKGFVTVECPYELSRRFKNQERYDTVLLECLSNLLANEMYILGKKDEEAAEEIWGGIKTLSENANNLIIVSNDVFSELDNYDEFTHAYLKTIGRLNRMIAASADAVAEIVCGLPIYHKGKGEIEKT